MVKLTRNAAVGDLPAERLLKRLTIAFAEADVEGVLFAFADDIRWHIVGERVIAGVADVRRTLEAMNAAASQELVIDSIIVNGGEGMINGVITTADGKSYAFCDVCRFTRGAVAKVQTMTSYSIPIGEKG